MQTFIKGKSFELDFKLLTLPLNDEENWVMIEFVLVGDAEEMESRDAIVDKGELRIVFTVQAKSVLTNFNG